MARGILGIVKVWGVDTKDGVQKANPLVRNPTIAKGSLVNGERCKCRPK